MRIFIVILFILLFITPNTDAQFLMLRNRKNFSVIRFYKGSLITYKLKDDPDVWETVRIDDIYPEFFTYYTTHANAVKIDNIAALKVERSFLHYNADGKILMIAGAAFLGLSVVNDVINHQTPKLNRTQLTVYPAMIITGFIMKQFTYKKCYIGNKYALEVILPRTL